MSVNRHFKGKSILKLDELTFTSGSFTKKLFLDRGCDGSDASARKSVERGVYLTDQRGGDKEASLLACPQGGHGPPF